MDWSRERVLVTGGTGFLGRFVVQELLRRHAQPEAVVAAGRAHGDLTSWSDSLALFTAVKPTVVFHLAARVGGIGANRAAPADMWLDNTLIAVNALRAAFEKKVPRFIAAGTTCAYPKHAPVPFIERDIWDGYPEESNAPYGIAKRSLLEGIQAYRKQHALSAIMLLPANLCGPFDNFDPASSHVIPAMIKRFTDARELGMPSVRCWGTGFATREFLYVEDCAEAFVTAAERYDAMEPLNVGTGREIAMRDLALLVANTVGYFGDIQWDPTKPDGQPKRRLDVSRAEALMGWRAKTSLPEAVRKTVDWWEANQK